jgi:hypothetical protein
MGETHKGSLKNGTNTFTEKLINEMKSEVENIWLSYGVNVHVTYCKIRLKICQKKTLKNILSSEITSVISYLQVSTNVYFNDVIVKISRDTIRNKAFDLYNLNTEKF